MEQSQIINHFRQFYVDEYQDEEDIELVINHLDDVGSLSYFYHITKEIEKNLAEDKKISAQQFQMILTKWFSRAVDNITFTVA